MRNKISNFAGSILRRLKISRHTAILVVAFVILSGVIHKAETVRFLLPLRHAAWWINDQCVFRFIYRTFTEPDSFYKDIVLVLIDDDSLKNFSSKWPLSRVVYAQLLNQLNEEGARIVGLDLVFAGRGDVQEDEALRQAIHDFKGDVVLSYYVSKNDMPISISETVRDKAHIAFVNTTMSSDGVARYSETYRKYPFLGYSFSLQIASLFLKKEPIIGGQEIILGAHHIPLNNRNMFLLQYFQPKLHDLQGEGVTVLSLWEVLRKSYPAHLFKNKIVIVGPQAKIIQDYHYTPLGKLPGVFVHLNALLNILNDRVISTPFDIVPLGAFVGMLVLLWAFAGSSLLRAWVLAVGYLLALFWGNIFTVRFFNTTYDFGSVAVFIILGLWMLGAYKYILFLISVRSAHDKAVRDPFHGLFIFNYFCFKVSLEKDRINLGRERYLVCIMLDNLKRESKKTGFAKLKKTWERITISLQKRPFSFWGTYQEDKIVGFVSLGRKEQEEFFKSLRGVIENYFAIEGVTVRVKIGYRQLVKADFFLHFAEIIPWYFTKLETEKDPVVEFTTEMLPTRLNGVEHHELFGNIEDNIDHKNKRLLELVEELKTEQRYREEAYFELFRSLVAALEAKDEYTKGHSSRVSDYAVMLAQKLNLAEEEIDKIRKAGTMHDVGKIGLPDAILHKRGRLTDEEYVIVKKHAQMGANIIAPVRYFENILPYILHHHERHDGKGYPQGLSGKDIPLGARIMAIADVFDALTTARDYKPAFSVHDAVAEMRRVKGVQFDPELVEVFVQALIEKGLFI